MVLPGRYAVAVEREGFNRFVQETTSMEVSVDRKLVQNLLRRLE